LIPKICKHAKARDRSCGDPVLQAVNHDCLNDKAYGTDVIDHQDPLSSMLNSSRCEFRYREVTLAMRDMPWIKQRFYCVPYSVVDKKGRVLQDETCYMK